MEPLPGEGITVMTGCGPVALQPVATPLYMLSDYQNLKTLSTPIAEIDLTAPVEEYGLEAIFGTSAPMLPYNSYATEPFVGNCKAV